MDCETCFPGWQAGQVQYDSELSNTNIRFEKALSFVIDMYSLAGMLFTHKVSPL